MDNTLFAILIGACGALAKQIIEDGGLVMPNYKSGKVYLGGVGGIIIGAIAGCLADHDPLTIFLSGYAGTSLINYLVTTQSTSQAAGDKSIEAQIRAAATAAGIDPDLAVAVAKCESSLNPQAVNINADGSTDRGLYQINNKYHPEVTDAQAFNPTFSINFFISAFKAGNISWWNSSKTCWDK